MKTKINTVKQIQYKQDAMKYVTKHQQYYNTVVLNIESSISLRR